MNGNCLTLSGHGKEPPVSVAHCGASDPPMGTTEDCVPHTAAKQQPAVNKGEKKKKPDFPPGKIGPSLTTPGNNNLSEPEKEPLCWHHCLGHIGIRCVQWLFCQGMLATSEQARCLQAAAAKLTQGPMCAACQCTKQRCKTMPGHLKHTIKQEVNALKHGELFSGQETLVDHFACNPLGQLLNTFGKE